MRKQQILYISMILILLSSHSYADEEQIEHRDSIQHISGNIVIEILPRIELLSGVLSHTSWMDRRGPKGKGNLYFQDLQTLFSEYQTHPAIQLAEELTRHGFTYDAPPNFVLHLSLLPELHAPYGYSSYLIERAGGKQQLERFRLALADLAVQTDFWAFFQHHRVQLQHALNHAIQDFEASRLTTWLEDFYGSEGNEFHMVFAPAMFPQGGYAAHVKAGEKTIIYQVIRERGESEQYPIFKTGIQLAKLTLHELSHSFVPIEQYEEEIYAYNLSDLFSPVKQQMKAQAYGTVQHFLEETIVRAVTALGMYELYNDESFFQQIVQAEESRGGFYLQTYTIQQFRYYQQNRERFPTFDEFLPYLLKQYADEKERLLSLHRRR